MFKRIGIAAVALVVATGYPAIKKWYEGDVTAEDAVSEIKSSVGRSLMSGEAASPPPAGNKENVLAAGSKTRTGSSASDDMLDAEKLFEELNKK